jgi:hypothetical protein
VKRVKESENVKKSYDVGTRDGVTIQVNGGAHTATSSQNPSALRTLDFDCLAVALFETDIELA